MHYHEYKHPYLKGIAELYTRPEWSTWLLTICLILLLITTIIRVVKVKDDIDNKWRLSLYFIPFLFFITVLALALTSQDLLKKGYYEGEVTVSEITTIKDTDMIGLHFNDASTPKTIKTLLVKNKAFVKKNNIEKGDKIKIKTDITYPPPSNINYLLIKQSDIQKIEKGEK